MPENALQSQPIDSIVSRLICDPDLAGRRRTVAADTVLYHSDAPAQDVFLIIAGEVRLFQTAADGSRRLLDIIGPGEWFGSEAVGGLDQYGSESRAMSRTTLCVLPAPRLLAALAQQPQASLEIIRQLAERLNGAIEDARALAFDDCRRRLVKALLKFSHSVAATANGDGVVLRMTHEQLAQAVGAARETVSLMLTQLRNDKVLRTGRNQLAFNPQALEAILNFE